MKICLAQMDIKLSDKEYNYKHAQELVKSAAKAGADVVCLPETWNVGFLPKDNLYALCDKDGKDIKSILGALAEELNINIVAGSAANVKGDKIYNTSLVFDRRGRCIAEYDKTHLFSFAHENAYFEYGDKLTTFELDGVKCGIIICYDVRFPELARTLALMGIKVLFIPAEWPDIRVPHWNVLCRARAIENQMFIACVNSVGKAGKIRYGGNSAVIDPWGEVLAQGGAAEEMVCADIDFGEIEKVRGSMNIYGDRRIDLYNINYK